MQDQKSKSQGGVLTGPRITRGTLRAPDPDLWLDATLERPIARSVLDGLKLRRPTTRANPPIRDQVFSPELRTVTDSVVAHSRETREESRAVDQAHSGNPVGRSEGAFESKSEKTAIHYDDPALPALELSEEVQAELRPRRIIRGSKFSSEEKAKQSTFIRPGDGGTPGTHPNKSPVSEPDRTTEFEPDLVLPAFQDTFEYVPAGSGGARESGRASIQPGARTTVAKSPSLKHLDDETAADTPLSKVTTNTDDARQTRKEASGPFTSDSVAKDTAFAATSAERTAGKSDQAAVEARSIESEDDDSARPIVTATPLSLTPDLDDELAPELPIDLESPLNDSAMKSGEQTPTHDTTAATLDDVWLLDDRELIEHVLLEGDDDSTIVSGPPGKTAEHSKLHLGGSSSADVFIALPAMDNDALPAQTVRTTQIQAGVPERGSATGTDAQSKIEATPKAETEIPVNTKTGAETKVETEVTTKPTTEPDSKAGTEADIQAEADSRSPQEQSAAFTAKSTHGTDSSGYIQPQLDSSSPGYVAESQPQPWQAQSLQEVSAYIFRESLPPLPVDIIERLKAVYMEESTQSDVFEPIMRQIAEICSADACAFVLLNRELMVYQCLLHHNLDELTTRNLFFGLRDSYVDHEVSHQTIEFTAELRDAFAFSKRFSSECLHYYHSMILFSLRPFDTHGHLLLFFREKPDIDVGTTTDRLAPVFRDLIPAILRHRDVTWDRERFLHPDTMIMDEIYRLFREISRGGSESIHVLHIILRIDSEFRSDSNSHSDSGTWHQTLSYLADGLVSLLHRDERLVMAAPDRLLVILRNTAPDTIQQRATELTAGRPVELEYKCMRFPDEGSNLYNYIAPNRRK